MDYGSNHTLSSTSAKMSGLIGNGNSKNKIPPPPPPPPPLKASSSERQVKLKTKDPKQITTKKSPAKIQSKNAGSRQPSKSAKSKKLSSPAKVSPVASKLIINDGDSEDDGSPPPQQSSSRNKELSSRKKQTESVVEIVRNDVPFFNEELCSDSEDEFSFPCCQQPNSPRFPPNPRPYREWDPAFLPSSTNIPTSIGRKCRRCGKPVYLAELYLSSRGAYHSECYKCCLCGKTLDSWSVAEFKGEVFCKGCYRRNFGTHGCGFGVGAGVLQTP